ncbi:MAG TPA: MBL fold metallo-hydrolase [Egibacteraceae bacterium]|nr:MBL fold metallo-hydrolase [Egibacteraceae bacterium]
MDNHTEQLADGVWRVEVAAYVNAFVVANDGHGEGEGLTVVDTGRRSAGPRLVRSIRLAGFDPRAVRDVLLTHWHADHAGAAARFARSSAAPTVWIGEADHAVLTGAVEPRPVKPHATVTGRLAARLLRAPEPVHGARVLRPGECLPGAGGLEVVAAPGHTPGHCAFWLPQAGVLLAGDAVFNVWFLSRGPRFLCSAMPEVPATLRRLAGLAYDTLAMAHGPPVTRRAPERVAALVS